MLNIVVPMSGRGSRFSSCGFTLPKPLIPVLGTPMIEVVINNLRPRRPHRFIFLCLAEHLEKYPLSETLSANSPGCEIIRVDAVTEGAACTVLLARNHIDNDSPLMIANCDQWIDVDIEQYLQEMDNSELDGLIMTMTAADPKWSYVRVGPCGRVTEVAEKKVISNEATVGIYNFLHGKDFVHAAEIMIAGNLRVNGEFYVAPAYTSLLVAGKQIGIYNIGSDGNGMHGLGIPEDLEKFNGHPVAKKALTKSA